MIRPRRTPMGDASSSIMTTLKTTPLPQSHAPPKEPTITPLAASPLELSPVAFGDHVRVPDGRTGEVIGFYRRESDSVLVRFGPGDSAEFFTPEVELL